MPTQNGSKGPASKPSSSDGTRRGRNGVGLQGRDSNPRPSGYEPDELPTALPCYKKVDIRARDRMKFSHNPHRERNVHGRTQIQTECRHDKCHRHSPWRINFRTDRATCATAAESIEQKVGISGAITKRRWRHHCWNASSGHGVVSGSCCSPGLIFFMLRGLLGGNVAAAAALARACFNIFL
jgi:hypothetical protein